MQLYTIRLFGRGVQDGLRIPGPLVRDLFAALDQNAKGAVRLRLEGRRGGVLAEERRRDGSGERRGSISWTSRMISPVSGSPRRC
jgi:hypothetical protein